MGVTDSPSGSCLVSPAHYEIFKNTEKVKNKSGSEAQGSIPALRGQRLALNDRVSSRMAGAAGAADRNSDSKNQKTNKQSKQIVNYEDALNSINDPPASARDCKHVKSHPAEDQVPWVGYYTTATYC